MKFLQSLLEASDNQLSAIKDKLAVWMEDGRILCSLPKYPANETGFSRFMGDLAKYIDQQVGEGQAQEMINQYRNDDPDWYRGWNLAFCPPEEIQEHYGSTLEVIEDASDDTVYNLIVNRVKTGRGLADEAIGRAKGDKDMPPPEDTPSSDVMKQTIGKAMGRKFGEGLELPSLKEFEDLDFRQQEQQNQDSHDDESPLYIQVGENHAFRIEGAHAGQYSEVIKQFAMTLGRGNFQEGQQILKNFQNKTGYPNQMKGSRRPQEEGSQMVFDTVSKEQAAKEFRGIVYDAGGIKEGWDTDVSDEDRDVKIADQETNKRKIKMMSKADEDDVKKNLEKQDKKAEDKAAKKAAKTKLDEDFNGSDEDDDVRRAEDEVKKRKIKMMSPRAEKILNKRTDRLDKREENSGHNKVKDQKKDLDEGAEVKPAYEPQSNGFLNFLKSKQ